MTRVLLLAIAVVGGLLAQGPGSGGGMFPWWDSPLARDLNLTESQRQQIRETVREYRDQLIQLRADVQKADGDLSDVLNDETPNMSQGEKAIDTLAAKRAAMTKVFAMMSLKMRMILTTSQWRELQKKGPGPRFGGAGDGPPRGRRRGSGRGPGGGGPENDGPPPQNPQDF